MSIGKTFKKAMKEFLKWVVAPESDETYSADSPVAIGSPNMNMTKASSSTRPIDDLNRGMNFVVFNATGGKVIQIHSYDPRTDRTTSNLYIITDKEDLGEELAQIITKESLSR